MNVCLRCNDEGRYMGIGFMMKDCDLCSNDTSDSDDKKAPSLRDINRNSKSYQKAIKDLMISLDITRKEAIKLFEQEYLKG